MANQDQLPETGIGGDAITNGCRNIWRQCIDIENRVPVQSCMVKQGCVEELIWMHVHS